MPNLSLRSTALALVIAALGCTPEPAAKPPAQPAQPAQPGAMADKPNTHGMFMLGTGTLYLCHMPMFHKADHQYQIILRAHLDAATTRTYLADRAANPGQPYNLINVDEEPFILPDLKSGKVKTFHVNVFRTYSNDNGGTPGGQIAKGAELTVDEIVQFRHFDPAAPVPDQIAYLLFGDGSEAHLDHVITREPDFQHVLTLPAVPAWVTKEQLQKGVEIVFPVPRASVRCDNPLKDASYTVSAGGAKNALQLGASASRWFSTGNMLNTKDPCEAAAGPPPAHAM